MKKKQKRFRELYLKFKIFYIEFEFRLKKGLVSANTSLISHRSIVEARSPLALAGG